MHRSLLTALAVTTLLCFATRTAGAEAAAHTRPLPAAAQDCLADMEDYSGCPQTLRAELRARRRER